MPQCVLLPFSECVSGILSQHAHTHTRSLSLKHTHALCASTSVCLSCQSACHRVCLCEGYTQCVWIHMWYENFHYKGCIPRVHQIEKLRFLVILRYKFKLRFWFDFNLHRGIWLSRFGGIRGCSIPSGICSGICQAGRKIKSARRKSLLILRTLSEFEFWETFSK